ncbi:MAG: alpha/beta hydrolase [Blautia sp.]|nr:alpha/beta hydrolase [Blautia sp.]
MSSGRHHFMRNLLAVGIAGAGVFEGMVYKYFQETFLRKDPDPGEETSPATPAHYRRYHAQKRAALPDLDSLPMQIVEIRSHDGICLRGRLYKVKENNDKVALCCHGFHASGINDMARFVNMYRHFGCDFLIISQRAHEMSDGKYITFGVNEHRDGIAWCEKLRGLYGEDVQILIHGLSMGAATVLMMAGSSLLPANVKVCVADSPYDDFYLESDHVLKARFPQETIRQLMLANMSLFTEKLCGFRLKEAAPIEAVRHARIPILFIHGAGDDFVPCEMGKRLFRECTSEKELFLVEGAAHVCSFTEEPEEYEKRFANFCGRFVK